MALTAPGLGSNLDVNGLVTQLMTAEKKPLESINAREAKEQARLAAFANVKASLGNLRSTMTSLRDASRYVGFRPSVSDSSIASISVSGTPAAGSYSLEVTQLAQAQKLRSGATYASSSDTLGSGTLTLQFGTYSGGAFTVNADKPVQTITIDSGASTLAGVRDAINNANAGVKASIVNDGSGQRLVLSSASTGAGSALRISVADNDGNNTDASGLSALAYDASTGGTANLVQTQAAQDAKFVLDGLSISKASNTVTDALEGVTLQLNKTNAGSPVTVTVDKDNNAITSAVNAFVKAWNDTSATLKNLSAYNAQTKTGATLQGDATVRGMQVQLRAALGSALPGAASSLSQIGVGFDGSGNLTLDNAKLSAAIASGQDVASLFAVAGSTTDALVKYSSATDAAVAGQLSVDITQAATRGQAVGSAAANLTITAGVNDTLSMSVNGTSISIALTPGTYTAANLAAELQSRINGGLVNGGSTAAVTVTQTAGVLTVRSNLYGSTSAVDLSGGNALSGLFGTPVSSVGKDVAGSIGGVVGTGNGQKLSAGGLSVAILGEATGNRGTLNFSRGYADQLFNLLDSMLDTEGSLKARTDSINNTIKDIGDQRTRFNDRMTALEKRYRAQFTALDTMLSRMTQTSSFLTTQLANLPKLTLNNN